MPSLLAVTSTLLLTITTLTLASPVANKDVSLSIEARDEWQVGSSNLLCLYMTNEPNWAGDGINLCEVGGTCGNKLPDGLAGNISSAGPEAGVTCFLYSKPYCTSDRSAPLVNPGYGDLSAIAFDKKAQSWQCWKWCGWMGTSSASSPTLTSSASNVEGFSERLVSVTTTIDGNAQTTATTTSSGLPAVPSSPSASSSSASTSQSAIFETSMTNIVVTHTYADGSTTVISSPLAIPVPVVTSDSSSTGSAVSITTTGGLASEGPVPSTTATTSDVGTSATTSATEVGTTASGVSITTTQGMPLPGLTITSEGVTIPVQLVSPSPSTSSNVEGQG